MNEQTLAKGIEFVGPWLQLRYEDLKWPALAVTIAHMGDIAFRGAHGFADVGRGETMTTEHAFQAGSQSKVFTAAATMQLEQAGKLALDDLVVSYVPELSAHNDTRWQKVTLEQLLSHGAGVARDGSDADYWELRRPFPGREHFMAELLASELVFDPDTQMKYSNAGYGLLGLAIERASGQPYDEVIRSYIIQPLELGHTDVGHTPVVESLRATGYGRSNNGQGRQPLPQPATGAFAPATGVYASTADLTKFYTSLIPGTDTEHILSNQAKESMFRSRWQVKNSPGIKYGLGLDIGHINGRPVHGHGGGFPGFLSKTLVDCENQLVVSGMTNCIDGDALMMCIGVMGALDHFRQHQEQPDRPLEHFNARLSGLWDDRQIVTAGNTIVAIDPHSWHPFKDAEELEYVDSETLRVSRANGFRSEGELVRFLPDRVTYCGRTMLKDTVQQASCNIY